MIPILFAIQSRGLIYVPNNEQEPEAWLIQLSSITYHRLCPANHTSITMISNPVFNAGPPPVSVRHTQYVSIHNALLYSLEIWGLQSCTLG